MATSGSYTFDPSFASLLDEAAERAGIDPATLSHRHINSARTSLNLMFTAWQARDGDPVYKVETASATMTSGDDDFTLTTGAYDILEAVIDVGGSGSDTPMQRVSRNEFLNLSDKDASGSPHLFYVDHGTLNTPTCFVWPVPDASVTITYDYVRFTQTVGSLAETLDVQRLWLDAAAAGLALRLAEKYNIQRVGYLKPVAEEAYQIARRAGSGNSRVTISARGFGRARTRRLA